MLLLSLLQPDSGRLEAYRPPGGPGIRLDSAVTAGETHTHPFMDCPTHRAQRQRVHVRMHALPQANLFVLHLNSA